MVFLWQCFWFTWFFVNSDQMTRFSLKSADRLMKFYKSFSNLVSNFPILIFQIFLCEFFGYLTVVLAVLSLCNLEPVWVILIVFEILCLVFLHKNHFPVNRIYNIEWFVVPILAVCLTTRKYSSWNVDSWHCITWVDNC